MFVRTKLNSSGSTSVQIISKARGQYKVIKSFGSATTQQEIDHLVQKAQQEIDQLSKPQNLFPSETDEMIRSVLSTLSNSNIQTVGPEIIFGKIFDHIGFNAVGEELFRHLVISRIAFTLSKLKTIDYQYRYQGVTLDIDAVYRFLDKRNSRLKDQVEQIAFAHTISVLEGKINVVFYDMTTLYFETSDEDDLRKTGFSKVGKHQQPQIFIGLLVGMGGYAIGYDIYEGNTYEGHTLIPFLEKISSKFKLDKPVVVADAGLLSNENIKSLKENGYEYILGARLKNEPERIKKKILQTPFTDGTTISIARSDDTRLIVNYSFARATKDEYNRRRGLMRLEKQIKAGRLTKSHINKRGYNKYLRLTGEITIDIDYEKYNYDHVWDGLKGYITNSRISNHEVMLNYKNLWFVEKAFRMSKTDLRIRPIYHRLRDRIGAHICIAFTAYCIYKELERALYQAKSTLSLKKAAEVTHNMYQITYTLPASKHTENHLLKIDEEQQELYNLIQKNF